MERVVVSPSAESASITDASSALVPPIPPHADLTCSCDGLGRIHIVFKSGRSCEVSDGMLHVSPSRFPFSKERTWRACDIISIDALGQSIRLVWTTPAGWKSESLHLLTDGEATRWLDDLLTLHLGIAPLHDKFAAPQLPGKPDDGITYTFGVTENVVRPIQPSSPAGHEQLLCTAHPDGGQQFEVPRRRLFRRAPTLDVIVFLAMAIGLIMFAPVVARIGGYVIALGVLVNMLSAWRRRYTRVTLCIAPGAALLSIRAPFSHRAIDLAAEQFVAIWSDGGELRALRDDRHVVCLLSRENMAVVDALAARINEALGLVPIAETTPPEVADSEIAAPTTSPPRNSLLFQQLAADYWRVQLPPRRSQLLVPGLFASLLVAVLALLIRSSRLDRNVFAELLFAAIMLTIFFQAKILRGLFSVTMELDADKVCFHRPTLFGMQKITCDRWAIGQLLIIRLPVNPPRADLLLQRRNRSQVRLFQGLLEEDALAGVADRFFA